MVLRIFLVNHWNGSIFSNYQTIGVLIIRLANEENYLTIGYLINIELSVAQLWVHIHDVFQTAIGIHLDFSNPALKEYEILRSPGSGASLLKTGQVYYYCAMRGICVLNRAISPTFLPLY